VQSFSIHIKNSPYSVLDAHAHLASQNIKGANARIRHKYGFPTSKGAAIPTVVVSITMFARIVHTNASATCLHYGEA